MVTIKHLLKILAVVKVIFPTKVKLDAVHTSAVCQISFTVSVRPGMLLFGNYLNVFWFLFSFAALFKTLLYFYIAALFFSGIWVWQYRGLVVGQMKKNVIDLFQIMKGASCGLPGISPRPHLKFIQRFYQKSRKVDPPVQWWPTTAHFTI